MEQRLQQIFDVGVDQFINKGYARTQMKDIAQGVGLSVGTMYHYFVGKADILSFIMKNIISPGYLHGEFELPIDSKLFIHLDEELHSTFLKLSAKFSAPYEKQDAAYTYSDMLTDIFETVWQYGKGCLLIEKNPDVRPVITEWYREYRGMLFKQVYQYLERFTENGELRRTKSLHNTTIMIIETIAFWAMHIENDAFSPDKSITKETAKNVCLDSLTHAFAI